MAVLLTTLRARECVGDWGGVGELDLCDDLCDFADFTDASLRSSM